MNLPPPSSPLTIASVDIARQTLLNQRNESLSNEDDEEVASIVNEITTPKFTSETKLPELGEGQFIY